jgi:lincosamide nucleotidyltransferase A/C/D/E
MSQITSKPKRPINQDRRARLPMAAGDLVELLREIEVTGIETWLDGGWGVDALLGEQRREHDDVDLIASLSDMPRLLEFLAGRGYELVDGELPTNVVLHDAVGRQVDIHPVAFSEHGDGIYRMRTGENWSILLGALWAEDASWTWRFAV